MREETPAEGRSRSLATEIRELGRERVARIRRREMDEMVDAFYDEDAVLLPELEPPARGREAVREFWRSRPGAGLVNLDLETGEVHGAGELAYEIGEFSRTVRSRHGPPFREEGKYLVVYRRDPEDGGYRAVAEIYNSGERE